MSNLPASQLLDAQQLTGDGLVFLYTIAPVTGGVIYVKADDTVIWQGHTYEGNAIQLSGITKNADGELSRPTLTISNPLGVYSALVAAKTLDNAVVTQKQVLRADLLANNNVFAQQTWKVRKVQQLNNILVALELRDSLDGQRFLLPARMYTPPDFPAVSL